VQRNVRIISTGKKICLGNFFSKYFPFIPPPDVPLSLCFVTDAKISTRRLSAATVASSATTRHVRIAGYQEKRERSRFRDFARPIMRFDRSESFRSSRANSLANERNNNRRCTDIFPSKIQSRADHSRARARAAIFDYRRGAGVHTYVCVAA